MKKEAKSNATLVANLENPFAELAFNKSLVWYKKKKSSSKTTIKV